ncbi:MAG: cytoskeleton protein RodZ [Gammaproteobacteria bacterium]|jgi:cytoskeleton protein RodZ
MNSAEEIEEIPSLPNTIGPGELLQAARIEQGLTVDDVANRMHLSKAILESIEENNFDEITAPIFVKGYLRAYARIVSLDEQELIKQYVELYSNEDPPISSTSNTVREISTDDARIKWMTYLVVIVLVALLAVWWWNKGQNKSESVSLDVQQPIVVEGNEVNETFDNIVEMTEVVVAIEADSELDVNLENEALEEETIVSSANLDESTLDTDELDPNNLVEDSTDNSAVIDTPSPAETENVSSESNVSADTNNEIVPKNTAIALDTESDNRLRRQAPNGKDKVILVIHADTWADIKDLNKHRLIYDLLRAGQSFELTGQAPFSAFFGNGHGVEAVYNGEQIDILSQTRDDNTARLKIGS